MLTCCTFSFDAVEKDGTEKKIEGKVRLSKMCMGGATFIAVLVSVYLSKMTKIFSK